MNLLGTSLIGSARAPAGGTAFHGINPAAGESLEPTFYPAGPADVERAAQLALRAFATYGRLPGAAKAGFLRRIAGRLEAIARPIVARAELETALPKARLQSELGRTCSQLRLFATVVEQGWWADARIDHPEPQRLPMPRPDVRSMLRPLGPVAVFGSSNFPLAFSVAGGDTASALAAGCPVLVKAHPAHPGTSELAGTAILDAAIGTGMPEGVFALLFDGGYDVGLALVKHAAVSAVGFTGSRRGGLALAAAAAERTVPIPVFAEMSSINPVFILPEAMRQRPGEIAAALHASVTTGVGQLCTNPGLIVVEDSEATRAFLLDLERRVSESPAGTMLTAGICASYRAGAERLARTPGVVQRSGAGTPIGMGQAAASLFTATAETFLAHPELMEEVFGPSTLAVRCANSGQIRAVARALEGQLTVTIHATEGELAEHRDLVGLLETRAGRLVFNGYPTGVEVNHAMVHGGPFPATTDARFSSVGTRSIQRFARPVCFQNMPDALLPDELKENNPLGILRLVDGKWQ